MKKNVLMIFVVLIWLFVGVANGQTKNDSSIKATKENAAQVEDQELRIIKKPRASGRSCSEDKATVRLKVAFHSSGKVTNVEIIESSGCKNFNNNAVKAAQKIKFKPAVKNGEAITIVRTVEYVYQLYDKTRPF